MLNKTAVREIAEKHAEEVKKALAHDLRRWAGAMTRHGRKATRPTPELDAKY